MAAIEAQRDALAPLLADEELAWYAGAQIAQAKAAWQKAQEQYDIVSQDPQRLSQSLGMFSSTTRQQALEAALLEATQAANQAGQIRTEAQQVLAEALSSRTILLELEAHERYGQRYGELEVMLKSLVDAVAAGRKDDAVNGLPGLLREQRALEVRTVTAISLSAHQEAIRTLQAEGIDQVAPQTYAAAVAQYNSARAFITEQPRNQAGIQEVADATGFAVRHARHIGKDVKFLQAHEAQDYERYLLGFEMHLNRIRKALELADLRDRSIAEQAEALDSHIRAQLDSEQPVIEGLRQELDKTRQTLAQAETRVSSLTSVASQSEARIAELKQQVNQLQTQQELLTAQLQAQQEAGPELNVAEEAATEGASVAEVAAGIEPAPETEAPADQAGQPESLQADTLEAPLLETAEEDSDEDQDAQPTA